MSSSEEQGVRLIGRWPSPFVMRVRFALNLEGIGYEFVQEEVDQKSELLLRSNPVHKTMPILLHHSKPICDSTIIVQYIDEAFAGTGPSILPSDPYERAGARFSAEYIDAKFPLSLRVLRGIVDGDKANAAEQLNSALERLEEAFGTCSIGKPFFAGDDVGYLDIALGTHLGWIRASEKMAGFEILGMAKTPELAVGAERFCAHGAVRDVMPDTSKLVEFAVMYRATHAPH